MAAPKGFIVCARPGCGHIFKPDRPGIIDGCHDRSCARKWEGEKRLGTNLNEKKERLIAAMDAEFDRIFKSKE